MLLKAKVFFFVTAADGAVLTTDSAKVRETPGGSLGSDSAQWRDDAGHTCNF